MIVVTIRPLGMTLKGSLTTEDGLYLSYVLEDGC